MKKITTPKKAAPKKKPAKPTGQSEYELAAKKAISLNPGSAAYSAAIAVIEVLLKKAKSTRPLPELVAFLESALAHAKDGTGQDGGGGTADMSDPGQRAK